MSPVTVIGDAVPLPVMPPGEDVTVYVVIGDVPLEDGGVNVTVACALPAVARGIVGAPGTAGPAPMVMAKTCDVLADPAAPVTVPVYVPVAVGVPLSRPMPASVSPGGSAPAVTV